MIVGITRVKRLPRTMQLVMSGLLALKLSGCAPLPEPAYPKNVPNEMTTSSIIKTLKKGGDYEAYDRALRDLASMGTPAVSAVVSALIETLGNNDTNTRSRATLALVDIGMAAVPELIKALGDGRAFVLENSAEAIGEIAKRNPNNSDIKNAIPALIETFVHKDWNVKRAAAKALCNIDENSRYINQTVKVDFAKVVPVLIEILDKGDTDLRKAAAFAVKSIAKAGREDAEFIKAVPKLIEKLMDENEHVQMNVAFALGDIKDVRAIPKLIERLSDKKSNAQPTFAIVLGEIKDVRALPALINALKDTDEIVQLDAAEAIGEIGKANPGNAEVVKAIPALVKMLTSMHSEVQKTAAKSKDKHEVVQFEAARALGNIGEANPGNAEVVKAIPALVKMLKNVNPDLRKTAARSLGMIAMAGLTDPKIIVSVDLGMDVRSTAFIEAVSALIEAMAYGGEEVQASAALAFIEIENLLSIRTVVEAVSDGGTEKDKDELFERTINTRVVSLLMEALENGNETARAGASWMLGMANKMPWHFDFTKAVPLLVESLNDKSWKVQLNAIGALGKLAAKNHNNNEFVKAVPASVKMLGSEFEEIRLNAIFLLGKIAEANPGNAEILNAVPTLIKKRNDKVVSIRRNIVLVLGKIRDPRALQALKELSENDTDQSVRQAAADAVGAMSKE